MKLIRILLEASKKPKAIVMAGGGGVGKSYLLNLLGIKNIPIANLDKFVEDPNSPGYNNLAKANSMVNQQAQEYANEKQSFVWDTTASNPKKIQELIDKGFDVYMVMVYTHPIVSYISNFTARDRNIPASAVFATWNNVYNLIDTYNKMLGGNLSIFINDRGGKYDKEIESFNIAAKNGIEGIKEYLKRYNAENETGKSSYRNPVEFNQEQEQEFLKSTKGFNWNKGNYSEDRAIKSLFSKQYEKDGTAPDIKDYEKALDKYRTERAKQTEKEEGVLNSIADMLFDDKFQKKLKHSSPQAIKQNINSFIG